MGFELRLEHFKLNITFCWDNICYGYLSFIRDANQVDCLGTHQGYEPFLNVDEAVVRIR